MSKEAQEKYKSATLTEEELDALVDGFLSSFATNTIEKFIPNTKLPALAYGASKAALNALTRVQARHWSGPKTVLILAVTPGYCATDMNHHGLGVRPAEFGAEAILYVVKAPLAYLESGAFYQDEKKLPQSFECAMDLSKLQRNPDDKA